MLRFLYRSKCSLATTVATATTARHYDEMPGPKSYPLVGSIPNYLPGIGKYDPNNVLTSGILKFHDFGPIYKERFFGHEAVFLYNPADIETLFRQAGILRRSHLTLSHIRSHSNDHVNGGILVESGSAWSQLRTGSQQSLTMEALRQYLPKVDELTLRLLQKIDTDKTTQAVMQKDFLLALLAHNCDIVGYILFGLQWDCMNEIFDNTALTTQVIHSSTYFNRMMAPMDNGLMLWKHFPSTMYNKLKTCSQNIDFIPKREVQNRLRDRSLAEGPGILNSWIREGQLDKFTMTSILSDLLLAGVDTTSYTLAFTLYLLSVHKTVQDKLYQEIQGLTAESQDSIDVLAKAKYLKQVVKETMRLYPVSVGTSRVLEKPCVIGDYKIPSNVTIITMNQVTCRLDEYVEKASEFIPERYDADSGFKKMRPFTTLPFGHGPRACIGRRVAEMSMYQFLYRLVSQYEIKWTGSRPLGCIAMSLTEPDGPLHFEFSRRKN